MPRPPSRGVRDFPWSPFLPNLSKLIDQAGGRESFAAKTGISFWTIGAWFRRSHAPRLDNLLAIRQSCHVQLDTLLFGMIR